MFSDDEVGKIFHSVFRASSEEPGFYFKVLGENLTTHDLRHQMVNLKKRLDTLCQSKLQKRLNYQSMGRFNHVHTSKFHRDTASSPSVLVLGYEPSKVVSKVRLADYVRFSEDSGTPIQTFSAGVFDSSNFQVNESSERYITELKPFETNTYKILILNNSSEFGVFHSGEIHSGEIEQSDVNPSFHANDRVINHMMLYLRDLECEEEYSESEVDRYINYTKIDR